MEIHLMAADKFRRIFDLVSYKWILGLTATLERLDGEHTLLEEKAPVIDDIPQKEAILRGWVSDFTEINLPVYLYRAESDRLDKYDRTVRFYMKKFGDFKVMQNCMKLENAKVYAATHFPWEDGKEVQKWAILANKAIMERKNFLYNAQQKIEATVELAEEFKLKTIMFSQSVYFAEEVHKRLPDSVIYHSDITSKARIITREKVFKTEKGAKNFSLKIKNSKITKLKDSWKVKWKEVKKIGPKELKKEALDKFRKNLVKYCCTAKALDQGTNIPDIQFGIDPARTSNPTQHIQRTGRVIRKFVYADGTEKVPVYVNLYIPNSTDEKWLRNCQSKNPDKVIWVNDIDECKTIIHKILCKTPGKTTI